MNILIFLLIYVPMPAGRCLSVEGTALLKLKIDGSFINAKVNIRQSNYYIIKSCREYLSTEEHISNDLATAWEFKETEERREMHLSHSTMSEPKNLAPLVTHIGGGTQEHGSTFPFGEIPFFFHRNLGAGASVDAHWWQFFGKLVVDSCI